MEYCGGGSVSDLVQAAEGPLAEEVISYICAETLAGLNYLHAIGKVRKIFWRVPHIWTLHLHSCRSNAH